MSPLKLNNHGSSSAASGHSAGTSNDRSQTKTGYSADVGDTMVHAANVITSAPAAGDGAAGGFIRLPGPKSVKDKTTSETSPRLPTSVELLDKWVNTTDISETERDVRRIVQQDILAANPIDGLHVKGDLDLFDCGGLTTLPEGLSVGGYLNLTGCTGLTTLPEGLSVGGYLNLRGCTGLTTLPTNILNWGPRSDDGTTRNIYLEGSGISQATITRIQAANPQDMQFLFSARETPTHDRFSTLAEAFEFWRELAKDTQLTQSNISTWGLHKDSEATLIRYLGRLQGTADYENIHTRPILAAYVMKLLSHFGDSNFRDSLLAHMHVAMTSCGDRLGLAMNDMEIAMRLHDIVAQDNIDVRIQLLKKFGIDLMKLDILNQCAKEKVNTLVVVDEIEVYLAYQTRLRERLDLPIFTHGMLYGHLSYVTPEDIEAAYKKVTAKTNDEADVADYLQNYEPLQKESRRRDILQLSYDKVEIHTEDLPQKYLDNTICIFTQEPLSQLKQPVYVKSNNHWHVYEFEALCKWWIEHGTDPSTRTKIEITAWRRPKRNRVDLFIRHLANLNILSNRK